MRARNSSEGPEPCNSDEIECEPPPLDLSSGHAWALFMKPGTQNSREDEFGECQEDTDDEDKVALVRNITEPLRLRRTLMSTPATTSHPTTTQQNIPKPDLVLPNRLHFTANLSPEATSPSLLPSPQASQFMHSISPPVATTLTSLHSPLNLQLMHPPSLFGDFSKSPTLPPPPTYNSAAPSQIPFLNYPTPSYLPQSLGPDQDAGRRLISNQQQEINSDRGTKKLPKRSAAYKKYLEDPEQRSKRREYFRKKYAEDAEFRKRIQEHGIKRRKDPEKREKIREYHRKRLTDPEYREKVNAKKRKIDEEDEMWQKRPKPSQKL